MADSRGAANLILTFGKYKGQTMGGVCSHDPGYILWMEPQPCYANWLDAQLVAQAESNMALKSKGKSTLELVSSPKTLERFGNSEHTSLRRYFTGLNFEMLEKFDSFRGQEPRDLGNES